LLAYARHREIEKAEQSNEPYGRSGSFLNKLILHGNKKTQDQIMKEQNEIAKEQNALREAALSKENTAPKTSS